MIPLKDENPGQTFPLVTMAIITVNVAAYMHQLFLPSHEQASLVLTFGLVPGKLLGQAPEIEMGFPAVATLITSQFLHGGLFHLLGNMLYLWIFGNNIEDVLGKFRFIMFYLLCGILAALAHIILHPYSTIPMVGASGAIAGVLGAYLITFPKARVVVLVFIFFFVTTMRISAFWVLGFWFFIQLLYASTSVTGAGTNVAYFAHIGGFLAGLWLVRKFRPGLKWKIVK
jgi:membrane associated rhomboid family serine protease